jgi:hypothetical protein
MGLLLGFLVSLMIGKTGIGNRVSELSIAERARFARELIMDPEARWFVRVASGALATSLIVTTLPLPFRWSHRLLLAGAGAAASVALAQTITPERIDAALVAARDRDGFQGV